ncbi:DNA repair protein [Neosynechococcus sphagnicola sy1]|uniref:Nuclease SbcCD subunit D n=1 Tax=Neosynechococcus sphagnicola sy1 TaxID=1497020 RepID=A0A098TL66_9CYAN|nr:DNA repair exonuclease [Neosynechococcus sphagnicola]KGF73044.1 DNA repair protein [Neosynechococcus sphagnicola sy1]
MPRFLHIADIHLGFDRYDCRDRTLDFFYALQDVLERYAIAPAVDFVLIAGDLFEHRNIQPGVLNQAQLCLQHLQAAQIPVLAIEGNHDNRPYGTKTSWLRYLADWDLLILLEPGDTQGGEALYQPWNPDRKSGGYIDLPCGVRVLGSQWYGASAPKAIAQLATAIQELPPGPPHQILMFHHGLEGQIARYQGALRYRDFLPLKRAGIDYLALGHIHKHYTLESWIFNPGSLEANNIEEGDYLRGAYLVEITAEGVVATLKQDYYQRPIVRLELKTQGHESVEEIYQGAIAQIQAARASGQLNSPLAPIVALRIKGSVGFDPLDLNTKDLQRHLQDLSGALIFRLQYEVTAIQFQTPVDETATPTDLEREVFKDLLAAHGSYKHRMEPLAQGLMDLKGLQLENRPEADLYKFVRQLFTAPLTVEVPNL